MRRAFHALGLAILAGVVIAGCQSTKPETAEAAVVVEAPKRAQPPATTRIDPPTRVGPDNEPLNPSDGTPLGRTFYFEFDRSRIAEADLRVLAMHADFLRDFRNRSVVIEGHCDERGTREYNLALGERRAQAVLQFLTSSGVRPSQVEMVSFGEERPEDAGHDERAWAKNRRAVLVYR